jgi:hypothetical protein
MSITSKTIRIAAIAGSLAMLVGFAGTASAATWQQTHPRRVEVNHRLARQNVRIHREVRKGEITRVQARRLHREDRFVRHEERFMASQHHGHITHGEQHALNQQENGVGKQIGH